MLSGSRDGNYGIYRAGCWSAEWWMALQSANLRATDRSLDVDLPSFLSISPSIHPKHDIFNTALLAAVDDAYSA